MVTGTGTTEIPVRPKSVESGDYNSRFVLFISLIATLGGFLFGYDSGVINGTVEGLQTAFGMGDDATGRAVASMLLGSAIGAFFAGRLSDLFGRRSMLFVAAVLFIISAWGSGIAGGETEFIIYRVVGGFAVGAASVMAPAYISEIAPAAVRGRLASIQQVAIIAGLFLAFVSNYFLAQSAGGSLEEFWGGYQTWRWMFWMELIPAVLFLILLFFIPRSPRYDVVKDNEAGALKTLTRVFDAERARTKVDDIVRSLRSDHKPRLSDVLAKGGFIFKSIVWVGIGLAVLQQFVGINIVFYYGAVLWQAVGFTESDALLINVLSGGLSIAAVMVTLLTIDRIGRKPFLIVGSIGMAVTLALVAYAFSTGSLGSDGNLDLSDNMGLLALIAANAYVVFFNMSWGPVMWVMLGEMFPNQLRGSGLAVAGFSQWVANWIVTRSFLPLVGGIGLSATYGIYAAFALVSVVFVWMFVRETKGKELEEMTA